MDFPSFTVYKVYNDPSNVPEEDEVSAMRVDNVVPRVRVIVNNTDLG